MHVNEGSRGTPDGCDAKSVHRRKPPSSIKLGKEGNPLEILAPAYTFIRKGGKNQTRDVTNSNMAIHIERPESPAFNNVSRVVLLDRGRGEELIFIDTRGRLKESKKHTLSIGY